MKKVELLAPAGSIEALKAAISSGADAIYLGGGHFGARAYAKNFSQEEMIESIKLAHLYDVRVYITVNTLIYDHEFQNAMDYVGFLYQHDVDALIVQDLGLMRVIRQYYPDLEVHASTQMTIHNVQGAKLLEEEGVMRVVLARENSLEEVRKINEQVSIETEVFVHGALCVSYSGQCLMSSLIGGRSGNRGKCAQPCRKLYDLTLDNQLIERNKFLISPKDLNTINHLDEIIAAGVSSLKIEGRMKSPEYVAIVVSIYRKAIDQYYQSNKIDISTTDLADLKQIFNRQFTKGFLFNENGNAFINTEKNNNAGVLCGIVESSRKNQVSIRCLNKIHVQDGIYFDGTDRGLTISKVFKNGNEIIEASKNDLISLDVKENIKPGVKVYKTKDIMLEEKARNIALKKIALQAEVTLRIGQKLKLKLNDDLGLEVESETNFIVQKSKKQIFDDEKIKNQLSKLGNTPFYFESLIINKDEDIFVVVSALNELRRKAIDQLIHLRQNRYKRAKLISYHYQKENDVKLNMQPELVVYCHDIDQVKAALDCGITNIGVNEEIHNEIKENKQLFHCVKRRVNQKPEINSSYKGQVVSDLGSLFLTKDNVNEVTTNFNLNVTNSETIKFLKEKQVTNVTLSYEMNEKGYKQLLYDDKSNLEIIVYGFQEVMVTKYCLFHDKCKKQCQHKHYHLIDSKKEKFLVDMDKHCHMHIYNSKNLVLANEVLKLMKYGYQRFRLQFSKEDYNETVQVIKAYQMLLDDENELPVQTIIDEYKTKNQFTRGYFNKDIL